MVVIRQEELFTLSWECMCGGVRSDLRYKYVTYPSQLWPAGFNPPGATGSLRYTVLVTTVGIGTFITHEPE